MSVTKRFRNIAPSLADISMLNGMWRRHPIYYGCVGHWLLNEGGGITAYDISGKNNSGILTGATTPPTSTIGKRGNAISFDGTEDYISVGSPSILQITGALTYSFWFSTTSGTISGDVPLSRRNNDSAGTWATNFEFSGTALFFRISSGSAIQSTPNSATGLNDGLWHHAVGTYTPSTSIIQYVDGNFASQNTTSIMASINATSLPITIGARGGLAYFYTGMLNDVRIYNRAISAQEVMILYHDPFLPFRWASEQRARYYSIPTSVPTGSSVASHYYRSLIA